jgi:50S ribosomal protein L16 3-hydroxylase
VHDIFRRHARASQAELLLDFAEFLAEPLGEERRFTDPDLRPVHAPGEIDLAALARVRAAMPQFSDVDISTLGDWFGRFITRYRSAHAAIPALRPLALAQLQRRMSTARVLRNPFSRFAWMRKGTGAALFVAGERFDCPLALVKVLCARHEFDGVALARMAGKTGTATLAALVDGGHLRMIRSPRA